MELADNMVFHTVSLSTLNPYIRAWALNSTSEQIYGSLMFCNILPITKRQPV